MTIHTFYLPHGNRIDINDGRSDSSSNGVIDGSDTIRINNHDYTLDSIGRLEANHPDHRAWEYLRREIGVCSLSGKNLMHVHQIHSLREEVRYRLTRDNPTAEQTRMMQGFLDESNRMARLYGLPTATRASLEGLTTFLSTPPDGRLWRPMECFFNGGLNYCAQR